MLGQTHKWHYVYCLPILNIFVPHVEQVPVVAGLPFFIVIAVGVSISFLALHLTQYASIELILLPENIFIQSFDTPV